PPIDDDRLAEFAEHDIGGLQIAMQHAATMRVGDGVAHVDEAAQQLPKGEPALAGIRQRQGLHVKLLDGFLEALPANEADPLIRPAVVVPSEPVPRHKAGMLEPAGDFGFENEAPPAAGVVSALGLDLLQRYLAVKLGVLRHVDFAESAMRVGAQD